MGWGEPLRPSPAPTSSTGTTADIERAHAALDRLGVLPGPLATRVLSLIDGIEPIPATCAGRWV